MMTSCPRCWKNERKRRREMDMGIAERARSPLATLWCAGYALKGRVKEGEKEEEEEEQDEGY
jgi:hypothetical protein